MRQQILMVLTTLLCGCAFVGDLPPVDLNDPGWTTWTGQATWRPNSDAPRLAGDIVASRHDAGDVFVNFSKAALPLFTAHTVDGKWQIEFVERGRNYSGRGSPPKRFVWFALPGLLTDRDAKLENWLVDWPATDELVLENGKTGESIHFFVDQ
jgi:hypothetical protein